MEPLIEHAYTLVETHLYTPNTYIRAMYKPTSSEYETYYTSTDVEYNNG